MIGMEREKERERERERESSLLTEPLDDDDDDGKSIHRDNSSLTKSDRNSVELVLENLPFCS